ncbi:MAG: nucleotide pyrophosphohydrolase [Phaeospirillum sp.]|nr:nucleotide pyrophosphohydrolase [Phaeospirillum sp.]
MKETESPSLAELTGRLIAFRDARDWRQFHTVKNLIVSLTLEAAELLEVTQWKTDAEVEDAVADPAVKARLEEECADVFLYLLLLTQRLDIDLVRAAAAKIVRNDAKYPADKSRGNARKYNEL